MKFLLNFIISAASISNSNIKDKTLILKEIMELPPNLFYEENRESFQKRIEQGKFWVDQEEKIRSAKGILDSPMEVNMVERMLYINKNGKPAK